MKKYFDNRLEAIDWIAQHAEDEVQFEVMREDLTYNFIYSGKYFVELDKKYVSGEVVGLKK